jgi:predicted dehydrogenase
MLRIGIVGSDNSHAVAYSKLANIDRIVGDTAQVVAITGPDPERTKEVAGLGNIPEIVDRPEDLLGKVDAVLVVHRHGDLHLKNALPFLEAGLPVYIDKPLTISLDDAAQLFRTAKMNNALLTSYSSLRYADTIEQVAGSLEQLGKIHAAHMTGPCDFSSEYGGPFFYATHVLEMALRLLGDDVATVRAIRIGSSVIVTVVWQNDTVLTISYLTGAAYHFHLALFGEKGMISEEVITGDAIYAAGLKAFLKAIDAGEAPLTPEQLIRPIAIVHAIQQSLANDGSVVDVQPMIDQALA